MKLVTVAVLLCVGCAGAARQNNLYKNKRIIKVRVPPRQHPDFYNGPKGYLRPSGSPIRFKEYHNKHNEFIRPNYPPFYASYNNVYVKHQSRPPPPPPPPQGIPSFPGTAFGQSFKGFPKETYHKYPLTYGSSFPHKASFSSFKFPSVKDEIRITHSQAPSVAAVQSSHSSSSSSSSSPSSSSSFGSSSSSSFAAPSSSTFGSSHTSSYQQPTSYYVSTPHAHVQSSDDNHGPIREIPAPNLGPKPDDALQGIEYTTYGKGPSIDVTNLVSDNGGQQLTFPATQYYSTFGHENNFDVINDNHLSTATIYAPGLYREAGVATATEDSGHDAIASSTPSTASHAAVTPAHSSSSGYEVTEEPTTGHAVEGQSVTSNLQYYYSPDPDPSLPVHKVPSTKDLFAEQKLEGTYVPQVTQNFQILEGGSVAAPLTSLSTQELFHLMHGFPRKVPIVAEPVVAVLGQPGAVYVQQSYPYAAQSGEAHQQGQASQLVIQQHQAYVPQQQYENYYAQAQAASVQNYHSEDSSNQHYEPVASESRKRGNLMKMDEDTQDSASDTPSEQDNQVIIHFSKPPEVPFYTTLPNKQAAEALATLQAAGSIGSNYVDRLKTGQEEKQTPSLNNLFERLRGDQGEETVEEVESNAGLQREELSPPLKVELTQEQEEVRDQEEGEQGERQPQQVPDVEVQRSIPIYETSYASSSLLEDSSATENGVKTESFGKRIKPK